MNSRVAIIAALPREIAPLVQGWRADEASPARGVFLAWSEKAIVVCAGMGKERARIAAEEALSHGSVHAMISAGWCGALRDGLAVGNVHRPRQIVDADLSRRYDTDGAGGVLVTSGKIANRGEKQRLAREYSADLVDMEASAVAEVAQQQRIPFSAVKAVSDEYDFELPGLERFVTAAGGFREGAFAAHLILRPLLWAKVFRMGRASSLASRNLCRELRETLEQDINAHLVQAAHQ
jgi:adenosylhomocysteine nucleosidase